MRHDILDRAAGPKTRPTDAADTIVIRPQQAVAAGLTLAVAALVALIVVGALRTAQPMVSWLGAAAAIGFLPTLDWYRRATIVDDEGITSKAFQSATRIPFGEVSGYGVWRRWSYRSGAWTGLVITAREGARIDVSISACRRDDIAVLLQVLARRAPQAGRIEAAAPVCAPGTIALTLAAVTIALLSMFLLSVTIPQTLGADRLFSEAAAVGVLGGLGFGALAGRFVLPRAPIVVVATAAIACLAALPAAAFLYNDWPGPRPRRTEGLTVMSRQSFTDRDHRVTYVVDVDIDGMRKRLTPARDLWERLPPGAMFQVCVRDGALGFPTVVNLTSGCRAVR